jgi:ketoreductase RED1
VGGDRGAARPDALLASSSSALPATAIAERMRQRGRLIIGHPFNPPHLVPLVEVVPGAQSELAVAERAVAFYRAMGKRPQLLRMETPGCVASGLQTALFREAVHLVSQPSRRWMTSSRARSACAGRFAGPFQTYHPGGGPGGLPAFLEHFRETLEDEIWPSLGAPSLDEPTVALLGEQAQHFGGTVEQLAARRDQAIVRLMRALREIPPQGDQ